MLISSPMKKKSDQNSGFVYSTNPDFKPEEETFEDDSISSKDQNLRIHLDRLGGNKVVTRITGFAGNSSTVDELGKTLKQKCGTGGSVKDMDILLQGDKRDLAMGILLKLGYKVKKAGG